MKAHFKDLLTFEAVAIVKYLRGARSYWVHQSLEGRPHLNKMDRPIFQDMNLQDSYIPMVCIDIQRTFRHWSIRNLSSDSTPNPCLFYSAERLHATLSIGPLCWVGAKGKQKSPGRATSRSRSQPPTPGGKEKVTQINVCIANKQMHDKHKDQLPLPQERWSKC